MLLGPTRLPFVRSSWRRQTGGGDVWGTVSIDQLIDAIIRLTKARAGITSFKEQAQTAAGGIETQMANMNNAITRGALEREAFGSVILSFFGDVRGGILAGFKTFNGFIKDTQCLQLKRLFQYSKHSHPLSLAVLRHFRYLARLNYIPELLAHLAYVRPGCFTVCIWRRV